METSGTTLTVRRARKALAPLFVPGDLTSPEFLNMINAALEPLHGMSAWKGAWGVYETTVPESGKIHLPEYLESVAAARLNDRPVRVIGEAFRYIYSGAETDFTNGTFQLVEDGVSPLDRPLPDTGVLTLTRISADVGAQVLVIGLDENGATVTHDRGDGEWVTLTSEDTDTTSSFSRVYSILKPKTVGRLTISRGLTEVASIGARIEEPVNKVYVAPNCNVGDSLTLKCRRKFLPVAREEDSVFPGSIPALRHAMFAVLAENEAEFKKAEGFWASAIRILNDELRNHRGAAFQGPTPAIKGIGPRLRTPR